MSATRPSRGISLPRISGVLVVAAAVCAAWLLWSEFHDRGWIPGVEPPKEAPVNRLRVVEALVQRGRDAVPELVESYSDADPKVRRFAILGLGRIGPNAAEALDVVRKALADEDQYTRATAINAFWEISQDPQATAPTVAHMLTDSDRAVHEAAAKTLETIGPPSVSPVIAMLQNDSEAVRSRALRVLWTLRNKSGPRDEIDVAVRRLLSDPDPSIHNEALCVVVGSGQGTVEEIRELLHASSIAFTVDSSPTPVEMALYAIPKLGPEAVDLLPEIIGLLDHLETLEVSSEMIERGKPSRKIPLIKLHVRFQAILGALGSMKVQAKPAVPTLMRRLGEIRTGNRILVAKTLVDIEADPDLVIPVLTPFLSVPEPDTEAVWHGRFDAARQAALVLLRASPDEARRQVSQLIPQLQVSANEVNKAALYAIWGLAPVASEAVPALTGLVAHPDGEVVWHVVVALGEIGPSAAPAVPVLIAPIKENSCDIDAENLSRILEAFGRIGPTAKSALPVLTTVIEKPLAFISAKSNVNYLEHSLTQFQLISVASIGQIGESTPQVIAVLRAQLHRQPVSVQCAALKTLAMLDGSSPEVLAELIGLLGDGNSTVRGNAALAIGNLKTGRSEAIAALIKILADENPYVRTAAAMALGKIGPAANEALTALREIDQDPQSSLPFWQLDRMRKEQGKPGFEHISELNNTTIHAAVQTAIREIESVKNPTDQDAHG